LFELIREHGQRIALASSANEDELQKFKKIANIEDLVAEETSSSDAQHSKPYPDIFEAAMDRLGNPPKDSVLIFGDSPYDAMAAQNANIRCVGLLCGGFPQDDLVAAGCVAIFNDPKDLHANYERLITTVGN
jgi:phosphoglycolate phosphatase-like HAD superfamily hydrolase